MGNYVIFTDSGADVSDAVLEKWGVKCCPLTFAFDGDERSFAGSEMPVKQFYDKMRSGGIARTSALNAETAKSCFRPELERGNDVFYLAFSSGLSSTYSTAKLAAEELSEEFPDRKIIVSDSLCASAGQGLLLWLAVKKRNGGTDILELEKYCEETLLHICHWFTVDDLVYLKRGGRISAATALAGTVLGIKPVLHVDDEGHLINMSKVRGRKASIRAIADKLSELKLPDGDKTVFISHGDCADDAAALAEIIKSSEPDADIKLITDIGPVIGAHSGPGTLAVFFVGKNR